MTAHPTLNDFFQRLDEWRHFPAFPLEARSEVFFALFLPTVLEAHFKKDGVKIKPQMIPQFPLRQNRLDPRTKKRTNHSNNVDFLALSEGCESAFLIELKTDMGSIDKKQICYLQRAKRRGMRKVLEDLKSVVQASKEKRKYYHLLSALSELGLMSLPGNLKSNIYPEKSGSLKSSIDKISVLGSPRLEVVFVQPRPCKKKKVEGFKYIYFDEFADCVNNQGKLGRQFACYLRKWIKDPAEQSPQ